MTPLNADKQQMLMELLRERSSATQGPRITPVPTGTPVPLNPPQARIWFSCRQYPDTSEYSLPELRTLDRALDLPTLRAVTAELMARHDVLRVRMFERDGVPMQQDDGPIEPPVTWQDLRHLPTGEAEAQATASGNQAAQRPFPLDGPCFFQVIGFALPGDRTMLAINFHHIVIDGLSRAMVVAELDALLAGRPLDPAPPVGFLDYVAWEQENADETAVQRDLSYWTGKLAGDLPVLDLPRDRPRPATSKRIGGTVPLSVPGPVLASLRQLATDEGSTLFVVVMAAYKLFLARMSGQRDIIVGAPLAGRDHEVAESIVGCFVKSAPLRTDLSGDPTFREVVRQVQETVLEAHDHQTVPFDRVVAELGLPRLSGVQAVFQTMVNVQSTGAGGTADLGTELDTNAAMWDLAASLFTDQDGMSGVLVYDADLFEKSTALRFAGALESLLETGAGQPDARAFELPLLAPAERERGLRELTGSEQPDVRYRTMAQPFEEQARRTPDAVAVHTGEGAVSYAELNARANRLARVLLDAGVRPGTVLALCLDHGADQIVARYAAAKLGAPYTEIAPEQLADAAPDVVITDRATAAQVPTGSWRVVSFADAERWAEAATDDPPVAETGYDLLRLVRTPGRPGAVAHPVGGALAELAELQRAHPLGPGEVVLPETPDGAFWPLSHGGAVLLCPPVVHREPRPLLEHINAYGVTTLWTTPSVPLDGAGGGSLRRVFYGGEPVTVAGFPGEVITWQGWPETGRVTEGGRRMAHHDLYVLDETLEPTPVGVAGELYVGGEAGLARGYHRLAAPTAERFVADPFGAPGARMVRTGELCRRREDGVLEHLGPIDRQITVHGMRIERATVEAAFTSQSGVALCAVTAAPEGGLAAFVVPAGDRELSGAELVGAAARQLPDYLVPGSVTVVERIVRGEDGGVDVAALLDLRDDDSLVEDEHFTVPETQLEAQLAAIYARLLRRDAISVTDSFFDLGGHSMLVFKLIEECASELGLRPSVQDVFTSPKVRDLAATLGAAQAIPALEDNLIELVENPGAPLVVFVHAASGSVLPFYEVAQRLGGEFALYALQSLPDDPQATIEEIAARYVAAVDAVRGVAPVVLAGWSMGGCVAVEMARHWLLRGERVAATLLLDTWAPPSFMSSAEEAAEVRAACLALDVLRLEGAESGAEVALAELTGMVERNRAAFLDYWPEFYPAEVELLRASDPLPADAPRFPAGYMDDDRGWGAFVTEVETTEIKGSHLSLFDPEHVDQLASAIRGAITRRMSYEEI
ncbi:alpha/beta fold hydrolase [Streptomyces sp. H10-C2]|uniref:non-ribosomal peptide synthetase n=1 Tax=unclassified Streptomyces TaxID=2593676 RepID=UPI0024B8AAF4|nr:MULTISPECIES: condensation domain-containing protein [unclassified Streptomyces]MDJ0344776.1 alpha/beta fold hydrolase [Streptomyces sp. PH10-H1]MDJ0369661.1 alpha/beta fold hydrolase [Streptomyces sp. H10-C2]